MFDATRLWIRYVGVSIRAQMQYRASFVMLTMANFFASLIGFLGLWALFARFDGLRDWELAEVALFYGMVNVAFAIAEAAARGFDMFPGQVKSGEFDRVLLRPRSTALQVAAREVQVMRVGRLLQGLAVLLWGTWKLNLTWTPAGVALLMAATLGGACLFSGLFVLQATMAFWTIESLEIVNCATYGGVETAQYPVSIYRPWFRNVFMFIIPLATINYLPAHAILGRTDPLGSSVLIQWLSPLAGVLFLLITLQVWRIGVRHYRSTGS